MLVVLLTAVTLLGTAGYLYARFAVNNLGEQVLAQAAARVDQQIRHALNVAEKPAASPKRPQKMPDPG